MSKRTTERDVGIELARVFGCLIVIGVHVSLGDMVDGVYDLSRGLINCFLADGVAIFWLIAGCFMFKSSNYSKVLARTAKTIALPVAVYSVFCLFFSGYISNGGSLIQCTYTNFWQYFQGFKDAISLRQTIPMTGHLWYCYAYILVMLAFPALKAFVQWIDEKKDREIWFCVISFFLLIINDFTLNNSFAFSHHGLNAAVPAAIEIIWGAILYKNKDCFLKRKYLIIYGTVLFIVLNIIRMLIVLKTGNKSILYWYSSIGLSCGIGVVLNSLAIGRWINEKAAVCGTVRFLAQHTFMIYLIHMPIISWLHRFGVRTIILDALTHHLNGFWLESVYTVIVVFYVFILSLIVSFVLHFLISIIKKLFSQKKNRQIMFV